MNKRDGINLPKLLEFAKVTMIESAYHVQPIFPISTCKWSENLPVRFKYIRLKTDLYVGFIMIILAAGITVYKPLF